MAMTKQRKPETAAEVILGVLVYEFEYSDRGEAETKIKKRLRYYKLGPYNQEEVDLLRRLKDSLQAEIRGYQQSKFYVGVHGKYAAIEDFDVARMISEYRAMFPEVRPAEFEWFVRFAIFTYYAR
jgi:hypothetical protein